MVSFEVSIMLSLEMISQVAAAKEHHSLFVFSGSGLALLSSLSKSSSEPIFYSGIILQLLLQHRHLFAAIETFVFLALIKHNYNIRGIHLCCCFDNRRLIGEHYRFVSYLC